MPYAASPAEWVQEALVDAAPTPFWLDNPLAPEATPPLTEDTATDLLVIGGGFTGLWTALQALEENPAREVLIVDGGRSGDAASGRNGGFCSASLTHGLWNGVQRYPDEIDTLVRMGQQNLTEIDDTLARYGIDCSFERVGELDLATEPWQVEELREYADLGAKHGEPISYLTREQVHERVNSPLALAGAFNEAGALVDPARLVWGLRDACLGLGARLAENTPVTDISDSGDTVVATTREGVTITARQVALGTNAYRPLLRRLRLSIVPVYDYALMTEPLTKQQLESIGWAGREGVSDSGNQFHYLRLTDDNRMLFGGYDAIYHPRVNPEMEQRAESFELLATHLGELFPTLQGVRFSHSWGGAIDTCTRFSAFWGMAMGRKVAYSLGYTGLGVGASRFGARVMLDLLSGRETERTALEMVRRHPIPFPPEPLRSFGIATTTKALAAADANEGRRNLWLRTLDRFGLGFDS